jgi:hypothetical protein
LVSVVMGSEDHFADTGALLDYLTARATLRERFLAPLVAPEGGGGPAAELDQETELLVKTLQPLSPGIERTTPWGETPGTQEIQDMVRQMLPVTLGGGGG